jgi:hypothetical protein
VRNSKDEMEVDEEEARVRPKIFFQLELGTVQKKPYPVKNRLTKALTS